MSLKSPSNKENDPFQEVDNNSPTMPTSKVAKLLAQTTEKRLEIDLLSKDVQQLRTEQVNKQDFEQLRRQIPQFAIRGEVDTLSSRIENRLHSITTSFDTLKGDAVTKREFDILHDTVKKIEINYVEENLFESLKGRVETMKTELDDCMQKKLVESLKPFMERVETMKTEHDDYLLSKESTDRATMQAFESLQESIQQIDARLVGLDTDVKEIESKLGSNGPASTPECGPNEVPVYVKLLCQTGEVTQIAGGQNIFTFQLDSTYGDITTMLRTKIRELQDKDKGKRNFPVADAYWSKEHEVDFIKAFLEPNTWDTSETKTAGDSIIMDSDNCKGTLALLKRSVGLPTMYVTSKLKEKEKEKEWSPLWMEVK